MKKITFLTLVFCILFACRKNDDINNIPIDPEPIQGISAGYVTLEDGGITIDQYNTQGTVILSYSNKTPDIRKGSVITVDLDTMGYLRRVIEVKAEGKKMTLQTEQAYLNDVFVDKDFKLNTELIEPNQILNSKSSSIETSEAFTDKEGFIHPVEIIYYDKNDKIQIVNSSIYRSTNKSADFNIIDFIKDFSATDIFGKGGDNVHFYISEGHLSLASDAVFEFDFDYDGKLDEYTRVKKGDLTTFSFYLDSRAEFLTKLGLDMSVAYNKSADKKLLDLKKVTVKFMVGPVPVWISVDCDVYGSYDFNSNASLHANWGFESIHTLKIGGVYTRQTDSYTPIKEYTPQNTIYPLNINGEINIGVRFELYPRAEVMFYSFFGPYAEIVPYIDGNYSSRVRSQITPSGTKTFLAWNSRLDLGLDFRIGSQLTFLWGLYDKEFGPNTINCFELPIWFSPSSLELLTNLPGQIQVNSIVPLSFIVKDNRNNPVPLCPIYLSGDGAFSKDIAFTDQQGKIDVNWILDNTTGEKELNASIFKADGIIADNVTEHVTIAGVAPIAAFTASQTTITAGGTVNFTDQSTNTPTSWSWNFGDGTTSTSQNPAHTYSTAGTYTVTLKATNNFGNNTVTKTGYITVNPVGIAPVAAFTASQTTISVGGTVNFTDQSTNTPTSWSWNFGDGGTSTSKNPSHTYNTAGTYTVSLTTTNNFGSDSETKNNYITVNTTGVAPIVAFTASPTTISVGSTVNFTDQSTNTPTSWSWSFGDGGTSTSKDPSHTYNAEGTYTVSLTAANNFGFNSLNKSNYIVVTNLPTLTTTAISGITQTSASSGGNVTSEGSASVTARGVCWSTSANPTTALSTKTTDGTGTGSFISSITGLTANTTYYVRAYATNSQGTAYGTQVSFTTSSVSPVVPTLTTTAASSITSTTATSGGNISSDGGASVTARGVCWSTTSNPTTALSTKTTDGTGTGSFTSSINGLTANITYYVRAYATNSIGTAYGTQISFTTSAVATVVPTLTTTAASSITSTTATSGGNISSDGGASVTARGVCWSTSANPTIALSTKTTDGTGTGSFTSSITGLTANTTYYVRAYATNSAGTAYGSQISFITQIISGGTVSDVDGNSYSTVTIGNQEWMAENLKTTKYKDGTAIPNVTNSTTWIGLTTGAYCWYNNNAATSYGALYNWYTVNTGKLCPSGWHVPGDAEWTTLTTYLGGEIVAGGKLREAGTSHWSSPNTNATNSSGFTALPGGSRYDNGTFYGVGGSGFYWSSSEDATLFAWLRQLSGQVGRSSYYKHNGCSVRCLRN